MEPICLALSSLSLSVSLFFCLSARSSIYLNSVEATATWQLPVSCCCAGHLRLDSLTELRVESSLAKVTNAAWQEEAAASLVALAIIKSYFLLLFLLFSALLLPSSYVDSVQALTFMPSASASSSCAHNFYLCTLLPLSSAPAPIRTLLPGHIKCIL